MVKRAADCCCTAEIPRHINEDPPLPRPPNVVQGVFRKGGTLKGATTPSPRLLSAPTKQVKNLRRCLRLVLAAHSLSLGKQAYKPKVSTDRAGVGIPRSTVLASGSTFLATFVPFVRGKKLQSSFSSSVWLLGCVGRNQQEGAHPPGQQVHVCPFFPPPSLHSLFLSAERAPPRRPFLLLCGPSLQPHHTEPNHGETNVPVLLLLLLLLNSILQKP